MIGTELVRQKELENCSYAKTILTIIVVFYHSILFWNGTWFISTPAYKVKVLSILAEWLNTFHIYGFTLISGYLFYFLKHEQGKYRSFFPYIKTKAKRLLIPYITVSVVWVIPFLFLRGDIDWGSVLINYGLGVAPSQLWFLLMLFNVFIITWGMSSWLKEHDFWCLAVAVVFYGIGIIGPKLIPNVFQIWTSCKYIIFFLIGFKIRQHGSKILMKIPGFVWLFVSVLLFGLKQQLSSCSFFINILNIGISFLCNLVGALMSFIILQKTALKVPYQKSRFFSLLKTLSMPIYLFHQQLVYVFIILLKDTVNPYVHGLINFLGVLTLSILICTLLMKFKPTRFLLGEK